METTDIEKFKSRGDKSVRLIAIHLAKEGLGDQLEKQPYITSAVEQMKSILAKPVELRRYSEVRK